MGMARVLQSRSCSEVGEESGGKFDAFDACDEFDEEVLGGGRENRAADVDGRGACGGAMQRECARGMADAARGDAASGGATDAGASSAGADTADTKSWRCKIH